MIPRYGSSWSTGLTLVTRLVGSLVALTLTFGCAPTPRRAVGALVDFSDSRAAAVATDADLIAHVIVPSLGPADELAVLPIDDGSVQAPTRIVDINLLRMSFAKHSDGVTHAEEAANARRGAFLDSLSRVTHAAVLAADTARRRFAKQTDLIGAFQNAARTWRPLASARRTKWACFKAAVVGDPLYATTVVLVVASDMLQDGRDIDFEHAPPSSDQAAIALVGSLRAAGEIPDLLGVDVIVTGATGASASQVETVRTFWLQYFAAANAHVVAYDYDARQAALAYLSPPQSLTLASER